jgi:outer membrane protein TolC
VLTGVAPGTLTARRSAPGPIPRAADAVAAGIPADTLRRRPDVRAAERRLAAATAEIGVAKAQLYPALSLTGSLNTSAGKVSGLGDLVTGAAFAGLTQTLFDAGRNRSQVRSARAGADLALAAYKGTVLGGLEEVENALQSIAAARSRRSDLLVAQGAAETAAVYARSQYSSGLTDFLTLLQSELALLSARDAAASAEADRSLALIRLYLALGGGWTPQRLSAGGPAR